MLVECTLYFPETEVEVIILLLNKIISLAYLRGEQPAKTSHSVLRSIKSDHHHHHHNHFAALFPGLPG